MMEYAVLYYDSESGEWEDTLSNEGQIAGRWIQGLAELLNRYAADGWRVANERGVGMSHMVILGRARS